MDFCHQAEDLLGERHAVYVDGLATVAALAEQMGCRTEARQLLKEAEELHQGNQLQEEMLISFFWTYRYIL